MWAIGPECDGPGRAGRTRGPSDTGPSRQGLLVDPACPCTWTGFAQDGLSTPQALGHGPESPRRADRPRGETVGPQPGPVSPEKAGKPRGKSETSAILPEQLVETVGPQTRARFPGESWSTLRDLGPRPESPGTAGPHRGPSDSTASRPGQLVNTEGLRTRAPVARDKWSTPHLATMHCIHCVQSGCISPRCMEYMAFNRDACGHAA